MGFEIGNAFKTVGNKITTVAGITGLKIKSASPEILLVGGLVCMTGAIVTGIMASRKHDSVIDEHNEELELAKATMVVDEEKGEVSVKDEKQVAREVRHVYCRTAAKMVKLYAPTVALMALSTACFIGMHNIQASRITGLSGAYTGVKEAFERYQKNNIELNGQDNHEMCKFGWHAEEVEDPETGEIKKVKVKNGPNDLIEQKTKELDGKDPEDFGKHWFDPDYVFARQTSRYYVGNAQQDLEFLDGVERVLRNTFWARGWLVVNDVLDALGMERTTEGMYLGWVKGCGSEPELGHRDQFNHKFLAGHPNEPVYIQMNVHGNVYQMLTKIEEERAAQNKNLLEKAKKEDEERRRNS